MSSASLQIKAILLKEGVEEGLKEIRRFRVDEESNGKRLQSLQARVISVFNVNTTTQRCTLYWKDEDDDLIQFSTEEELHHAMDNMTDDTLRVYVIIARGVNESEGPSAPHPEGHAAGGNNPQPGSSFFHPPPPPPHHHPHSHCPPPPPFPGPWAHGGWKKWKPMGPGGWKGGWKGGMFLGCPWSMRNEMHGCGRRGRGMFKHGWDKKLKKMMKTKRCWMANVANDQREFNEVRQHVPWDFRSWVRRYVYTWYTLGPEDTLTSASDKLPKDVGQDLPQWLNSFLARHYPHPCVWGDGEMEGAPQCMPPVYFRWLCLFLPRFFQQNKFFGYGMSDGSEDDGRGHCHSHGRGFCGGAGFGWGGKHGACKKMKGGRHGRHKSSSESDDSDGSQKGSCKVPRGFRKFVRMSFKKLRKGKAENPKIKEKATRAGISAEVQEFVEQIMLEWRAKLSHTHYKVIAKEMMGGERTLPSGLPQEHFLWLVRFLARWQDWGSGKHETMQGCQSESSTDESSGEEMTFEEQGCEPCPPFPPPYMGMMGGAPPPYFTMYPGMDHPIPPPPPPGSFPMDPYAYLYTCPDQDSEAKKAPSSEEMVEEVTEGVKKL